MRPDQHHEEPADPADDTPLGRALAAYLAGDLKLAQHLPADQHAIVLEVGPVLAALRPPAPITNPPATAASVSAGSAGAATPSPVDDPIAIALGLVPDPDRPLAAHALGAARRRRHLKPSELRARLVARGWEVTTAEVAAWERVDSPQPPALVAAVADILDTTPAKLMPSRSSPRAKPWQRLLDDETIAARLNAWADDEGVPVADVRRRVDYALASAFHRNEREPTAPALLRIIEILRQIEGFLDGP
ncbi:hypothetical protein [Pseudonocardia sp. TRM90224]|uniref:hypothetical protein n=1 Tax=Pseudonocardia sp. TRM90224 TaxID=2812678 RepID=UPI001E29B6CA|nr:hypothetical protein [Pseudonocardia sp. TRM90224]